MAEREHGPTRESGDVNMMQLWGDFREFRGAVQTRLDAFDVSLSGALSSIRRAVEHSDSKNVEIRARLIVVEQRQVLVYRILAAIALVALGIVGELVRRALIG